MAYTRDQLITALNYEYILLTHDDIDDDDMSPAEYSDYLNSLSVEQLIDETSTDDVFTLDEYMSTYS